MSFPFRHIAIEGVIGAGKTTLATLLAKQLSGRLITEAFADNPFLPRFYADPERYALPLELSFLTARFQQIKNGLQTADPFGGPVISDYIAQKSVLFASITLSGVEQALFHTLYRLIDPQLPPPDLLIYLQAPLEKLRCNIALRGRAYENAITDDYLLQLKEVYERFLQQAPCPVLLADMAEADFLHSSDHFAQLQKILQSFPWKGVRILEIV